MKKQRPLLYGSAAALLIIALVLAIVNRRPPESTFGRPHVDQPTTSLSSASGPRFVAAVESAVDNEKFARMSSESSNAAPFDFTDVAQDTLRSTVRILVWVESTPRLDASTIAAALEPTAPDLHSKVKDLLATVRRLEIDPPHATGSGVVFKTDRKNCDIITNHHVVGMARRIVCELADGRQFEAELVGTDAVSEVAVIRARIPSPTPPPIRVRMDDVRIGEWAVAVGSPLSQSFSVTLGIVSSTNRIAGVRMPFENFVQTDAAINPGNSGGPLVDAAGRLIGINTVILSPRARTSADTIAVHVTGNIGIAFAIDSTTVSDVAKRILCEGRAFHGSLGIECDDLPGAEGVVVTAKHGSEQFNIGDRINAIETAPVTTVRQLRRIVDRCRPGSLVKVAITRGERVLHLHAPVFERAELRSVQ